ncbi:hypothetical protein LCGC14_0839940 [marine sediment metagenome]|uniref:Uncharacterized protein n=1 Tax=marine sediment metagenome TaxID=412755 RepID=A0A0F9RY30_9ZZZZ
MICGEPAIFYMDCPIEEGGCGEWSWCSDECQLQADGLSDILFGHIDHDGCNGECCANRHVRLSYRKVCLRPRQLGFEEFLVGESGMYTSVLQFYNESFLTE